MKLNQKKNTHVIVDGRCISVQYCITMDDVNGQQPAPYKVWVIINFGHPGTKSVQRLRIEEPQDIIEATDAELHSFLEREIECFFRHCDEENDSSERRMTA